jgi:poly(3-hydroxybutyrate) depolymerase
MGRQPKPTHRMTRWCSMRRSAILALLILMTAACGEEADESGAAPTATVSITTTVAPAGATAGQGCEALHEPGEYEGVGHFGDVKQPYWMVVPATYAELSPAALYVHLASGDGDHHFLMESWRPYLGDADGLTLMVNTAMPSRGSPDALASLVDQISEEYCVDPQRVHIDGTGNSFRLTETFACEYSDRVASFIAALGRGGSACTPDRPVPLLTFTGDPDRFGVKSLLDKWIKINGCDPEPVVEDLGSGVRRKAYQNCNADILFYDIEGMAHTLPLHEAKGPAAVWITEYDEVDYLEEAYKFFFDHPMP